MSPPSAPALLYRLQPQFHTRVWGGQRLRAAAPGQTPIGEAWVIDEANLIEGGPRQGLSLGALLGELGDRLLGQGNLARFGGRFPLLIKLLDSADWLSVQVHPDDAQARALVGPQEFGKTEAWHILEAAPGASILAGVRPGTSAQALEDAIRGGAVQAAAQQELVRGGDTIFIPAGTLHALGPGLLLYEVQQASDTTYRVYDWDRPASDGRALHTEQSVQVTRPDLRSEVAALPRLGSAEAAIVAECPYFRLEVAEIAAGEALGSHTQGRSLHCLTLISGALEVTAESGPTGSGPTGAERQVLGPLESLLVSAQTGPYRLHALGEDVRLLRASLPPIEGD